MLISLWFVNYKTHCLLVNAVRINHWKLNIKSVGDRKTTESWQCNAPIWCICHRTQTSLLCYSTNIPVEYERVSCVTTETDSAKQSRYEEKTLANDDVYIKKLKICANAKTKAQNGNWRRHMFSLEFQMLSPLYDGVSEFAVSIWCEQLKNWIKWLKKKTTVERS